MAGGLSLSWMAGGLLFVALFFSIFPSTPLFYANNTPSVPRGVYVGISGTPQKGDWVIFESKKTGIDFSRMPPLLLKKVYVTGPCFLEVNDYGVFIDGKYICSRPIKNGIPPYYCNTRVRKDRVVLICDHPDSFDSRHFGPLNIKGMRKVIPVWKY